MPPPYLDTSLGAYWLYSWRSVFARPGEKSQASGPGLNRKINVGPKKGDMQARGKAKRSFKVNLLGSILIRTFGRYTFDLIIQY